MPPPSDPREQAVVSVDGFETLTTDQFVVLDAQYAIEQLAERLGSYKRLAIIVRNLAHIHGEDI